MLRIIGFLARDSAIGGGFRRTVRALRPLCGSRILYFESRLAENVCVMG
jgi:hypothetical protein